MLDFYKNQYEKYICCEIKTLKNNENKCDDNLVAVLDYDKGWKLINNYILRNDREKNKGKLKIRKKKNRRIIIILESPHKKEYDIDNLTGYPALGSTGVNINRGIEEIINKKLADVMETDKEYDIILMNAIQYQTSLGVNTKIFRDRIWISLWLNNSMREEFIKRIKGYKPDIIINLCTKGNHSKDMLAIMNADETTLIGNKFIKSLNISNLIISNNKILLNNKIVCEIEKVNNLSRGYTLRKFVNNAIEEAFKNKIRLLNGPHPSSWKFERNNELKKDVLCNFYI
ncbi:hypothetical protein ACQPUY_08370 [Clostridium nigeriense]|uniref:hypothetical protein n=1 Tax=Clostridium nigeriense TaxID=1805470 RepID=UPI003D356CE0